MDAESSANPSYVLSNGNCYLQIIPHRSRFQENLLFFSRTLWYIDFTGGEHMAPYSIEELRMIVSPKLTIRRGVLSDKL